MSLPDDNSRVTTPLMNINIHVCLVKLLRGEQSINVSSCSLKLNDLGYISAAEISVYL